MFDLPLHPTLVHVPLGLAVILPFLLVALLVAIRKQWLPPRAWWLGVAIAVIVAGSSWVALQTGETDEERVENVVPESAIEEHEEAGEQLLIAAAITAGLALAAAFLRNRQVLLGAHAAATLASLVVLALAVRTGHLGGELVYRHGAASAFVGGTNVGAPPVTGPAAREDDD